MDQDPGPTHRHRTRAELAAMLPHVLDAPRNGGTLEMIVIRPEKGQRRIVDTANLSFAHGTQDAVGSDEWERASFYVMPDGTPDPDAQVCMMSARMIAAIAGPPERWPPVGDNLFLDADLSPESMPPGTRFTLGAAELIVTAQPHNGCAAFAERFGRNACVFVNTGPGRVHRLRGIYARVTRDGQVRVKDRIRKIG